MTPDELASRLHCPIGDVVTLTNQLITLDGHAAVVLPNGDLTDDAIDVISEPIDGERPYSDFYARDFRS